MKTATSSGISYEALVTNATSDSMLAGCKNDLCVASYVLTKKRSWQVLPLATHCYRWREEELVIALCETDRHALRISSISYESVTGAGLSVCCVGRLFNNDGVRALHYLNRGGTDEASAVLGNSSERCHYLPSWCSRDLPASSSRYQSA